MRVRASSPATVASHAPPRSESTPSAARVSSLRLVSWVDPVVIASGVSAPKVSANACQACGSSENGTGSAPTSHRLVSSVQR